MTMNRMWREFKKDSNPLDLTSFKVKDHLNSDLWIGGEQMKTAIRDKLLIIASNFFKDLELDGVEVVDVTLTGSLANYNWSEFSDVDLHILINFDKTGIDKELLRDYLSAKQSVWNNKHDILIHGFEVELYVQDSEEPHASTGVYSVLRNKWLTKPTPKNPQIDQKMIKIKASSLMDQIDKACDLYCAKEYEETIAYISNLKDRIKKFRQCGLESGGEFAVENLAFKVLRRNGYLKKLYDLATKAYDKAMSMNGNYKAHWENFKRELEEDYQQAVKRDHTKMKKRVVGSGGQANTAPYKTKPSYKRSKSAPAGFGGS